ncbi:MAG: hypothetical protein K6D96_08705 [Acetatifactor sp.]|nr:hypothetical protein [Acetatifactor sp.]
MEIQRIYSANNAYSINAYKHLSESNTKNISEKSENGVTLEISEKAGKLAKINEVLLRVTKLSVKAADNSISSDDRLAIEDEISKLISKIDKINEGKDVVMQDLDNMILGANGAPISTPNMNMVSGEILNADRAVAEKIAGYKVYDINKKVDSPTFVNRSTSPFSVDIAI